MGGQQKGELIGKIQVGSTGCAGGLESVLVMPNRKPLRIPSENNFFNLAPNDVLPTL